MSHRLEIILLGGLTLRLDGTPIAELTSRKASALLAYLVCTRQPAPRDSLAALFYGDRPQKRAAANLRVLLSRLRPVADYLDINRHTVALNHQQDVWVDAVALQEAMPAAGPLTEPSAARLEAALSLYHGDFLAGVHLRDAPEFETWMIMEQERLRQLAVNALARLVDYYRRSGQPQPAIDQANRLLQLDPLHEATHRRLMRLLAETGRRSAALSHYRRCCEILAEELGVEPAAETVNLYQQILAAPAADPAPAQTAPPLLNLPRQLTPLVGRSAEIEQICRLLTQPNCHLLTLVGLGGVGKTRLALGAAQALAQQTPPPFGDGVCFVPLAAVENPALIPSAIAEALHFTFPGQADPTQELIEYLRHKQRLLVLDNLEHLLAGAELLTEMLQAAPRLKILAASREPLKIQGEWLFTVAGLHTPPPDAPPESLAEAFSAMQLFAQSAARSRPDFTLTPDNQADVAHICRLVEGLPLALELAAAWLPALSCREIVAELTRSLDFLTAARQDRPARQRSMTAVFNAAWSRLDQAEQSTLARLSLFPGSFDRAAAAAVAHAGLPQLVALVDRCWLTRLSPNDDAPGPARYQLHNLLKRYAAERLAEQPAARAEAAAHHCAYFADFLQQRTAALRGAAQRAALLEIAGDIDNIRAAWQWAVAQVDTTPLSEALDGLFHFYDMRSWFQEGEEAFGRAVAVLQKTDSVFTDSDYNEETRLLQGRLLARRGWFAFHLGRHQQAREWLQEALSLLRSQPGQPEAAFGCNYLGAIYRHLGEYEQAKTLLREGLALARATGNRYDESIALNILGQVASLQGQFDDAQRLCRQALDIKRDLGDVWGITYSLTYLGRVAEALEHYPEAEQLFRESLAIYRDIDDRRGIAFACQNLGSLTAAAGDLPQAVEHYQAALAIFERIGNRLGLAACLTQLGQLSRQQGQLEAARNYLQRALALAADFEAWPTTLDILIKLAHLLAQIDPPQALELVTEIRGRLLADDSTNRHLAPLAATLKANLSAEVVAGIQKREQPGTLPGVVRRVLAQLEYAR